MVDGFTEASQAFSNGLEGTARFPEFVGRSLAGMMRANARLLDEAAAIIRRAADAWSEGPQEPADDGFDYERLADLIAARLGAPAPAPEPEPEPERDRPGS